MIQKFKTLMKENYKKGIVIFAIYLVVKWTLVFTVGAYIHSRGWTPILIKYWYVIALVVVACCYLYYLHHKHKKAKAETVAENSED